MNVEIDKYVEQVIYQNVDNLLSQPNRSIAYDFEIDSLQGDVFIKVSLVSIFAVFDWKQGPCSWPAQRPPTRPAGQVGPMFFDFPQQGEAET